MGMVAIKTPVELSALLQAGAGPHYVYVLRHPDGIDSFGGTGTPFYVGVGQRGRLFEHEKAAREGSEEGLKVDTIRAIWNAGGEVVRTIDSFHKSEPWIREAELIHEIGRLAEGTGPLLNPQTYSPSHTVEGVELRKYARDQVAAGGVDAIPAKFKLRDRRLRAGPKQPKSLSTVMGKVYATARDNPGVTGEELVHLLAQLDFSENKSAYTQSGKVCASWLCGYIEGAFFRLDKQHLAEYRG
jgi:hypothetical protein